MTIYKDTDWWELDPEQMQVIGRDRGQVRIAHPELKRSLWFTPSRRGNLYWRDTGGASEPRAVAYIIKNGVSLTNNVPIADGIA
jgi:hypothetical protein